MIPRDLSKTVTLPGPYLRAALRLTDRTLHVHDARPIFERLTPGRSPTFGELWELTGDDIVRVASDAGITVSPVDARALVTLFQQFDHTTLICHNSACEEPALSSVSDTSGIVAGTICPYCHEDAFHIEPLLIRRVNWATGMLVDPEMEMDIRSIPGKEIPLTDKTIRLWVNRIDRDLDRVLETARLPLYAFLAYFNLSLNTPDTFGPRQAERLLSEPRAFGLDRRGELERRIEFAKRFRNEREISNVPKEYLTDGKRRDQFTPVTINGRSFLIEGLIGCGDKCNIYRARTDSSTPQFVLLKVLVSDDDVDLFRAEVGVIKRLQSFDDVDSEFYRGFVPELVEVGSITFPDKAKHEVMVLRAMHQFDWSVEEIIREYSGGVHPKDMVWMMNRICEMLVWLHGKRLVHGAIVPSHLIVKNETHRVRIVDWGYATASGGVLKAYSASQTAFYPKELLAGAKLKPEHDLAMACRVGIALLGGEPNTGECRATISTTDDGRILVPSSLIDLLRNHAMYAHSTPTVHTVREFKDLFKKAATDAYGPPRYHLFTMPRA